MRAIVTRPAQDAQRWVADLAAHGLDALALPLIEVGPVADPSALQRAWQQLGDYVGVMFVSGNAASHFFASNQAAGPVFSAKAAIKMRAWATGPGTARALLKAGVAPEWLDAPGPDSPQFDSETLWQIVSPQVHAGDRVLIVRGADAAEHATDGAGSGREWFAERVAQAGGRADFVVAYQRGAPVWHERQRALAQSAATDGSVWLLSSSEALANLQALLPAQSWAQARALATHPRIAVAARQAGFGVVVASRPALADLLAALTDMAATL